MSWKLPFNLPSAARDRKEYGRQYRAMKLAAVKAMPDNPIPEEFYAAAKKCLQADAKLPKHIFNWMLTNTRHVEQNCECGRFKEFKKGYGCVFCRREASEFYDFEVSISGTENSGWRNTDKYAAYAMRFALVQQ